MNIEFVFALVALSCALGLIVFFIERRRDVLHGRYIHRGQLWVLQPSISIKRISWSCARAVAAYRSSSLALAKLHRRLSSVDVVERRGEALPRSVIWFATAKRDFSNASGDRCPATSGTIDHATFLGRDDIAWRHAEAALSQPRCLSAQNPSSARLTQLTAKIEPAEVITATSEIERRRIRRAM